MHERYASHTCCRALPSSEDGCGAAVGAIASDEADKVLQQRRRGDKGRLGARGAHRVTIRGDQGHRVGVSVLCRVSASPCCGVRHLARLVSSLCDLALRILRHPELKLNIPP